MNSVRVQKVKMSLKG